MFHEIHPNHCAFAWELKVKCEGIEQERFSRNFISNKTFLSLRNSVVKLPWDIENKMLPGMVHWPFTREKDRSISRAK